MEVALTQVRKRNSNAFPRMPLPSKCSCLEGGLRVPLPCIWVWSSAWHTVGAQRAPKEGRWEGASGRCGSLKSADKCQ